MIILLVLLFQLYHEIHTENWHDKTIVDFFLSHIDNSKVYEVCDGPHLKVNLDNYRKRMAFRYMCSDNDNRDGPYNFIHTFNER